MIAIVADGTFLYFLQPVISDGIVATTFLLSLATTRPMVASLAGDFYPMHHELSLRPAIQRLFRRLTVLRLGLSRRGRPVTDPELAGSLSPKKVSPSRKVDSPFDTGVPRTHDSRCARCRRSLAGTRAAPPVSLRTRERGRCLGDACPPPQWAPLRPGNEHPLMPMSIRWVGGWLGLMFYRCGVEWQVGFSLPVWSFWSMFSVSAWLVGRRLTRRPCHDRSGTGGTVVAWGYNGNGETDVPVGLTNVTAVAAGANHSWR